MTEIHFSIPDDEVECFTLRLMFDPKIYVADLQHKAGSTVDGKGTNLFPPPHGVASAEDPSLAVAQALQNLRANVALRVAAQNKGAPAFHLPGYPTGKTLSSVSLDLDLEL